MADDEDVVHTGGEGVVSGVSDGGDVESGVVLGHSRDDSHTASGVASGVDQHGGALLELVPSVNLASLEVELDSVVDFDRRVRVSDRAAVVSDDVRHVVLAHAPVLDLAELEVSLVSLDFVRLVSALDVMEDSKVLAGLVNSENVHETNWEVGVSAHLVVDLDQTFSVLDDFLHLSGVQGVLQPVLQKDNEWDAFSQFVGSSGGTGSLKVRIANLRKRRSVCPASTTWEQQLSSDVSWVLLPSLKL